MVRDVEESMQSNNPVLGRAFGSPTSTYQTPAPSAEQLEQMYQAPPAVQPGRMTYDEVVTKTGILLAVVVGGAAVGWMTAPSALTMVGLVVGLVLGLVNAFKKEPSPPLMIAYAAFMGLFLGGISFMFERVAVMGTQPLNGIVAQAILEFGGYVSSALTGRGSLYYIEDKDGSMVLPVFTSPERAQGHVRSYLEAPEAHMKMLESLGATAELHARPLTQGRFIVMPLDNQTLAKAAAAMRADRRDGCSPAASASAAIPPYSAGCGPP
jgi:hypothetical protein